MARKTTTVTIADPGRDNGKSFFLTEMSADQAESWGMRALLALAKSGVTLPPDIEKSGLAGAASMGLKALSGLPWEAAKPLLDEMLGCVKCIPDPGKPHITRPLIEDDIDEVKTRLKLRMEVWNLHTGFLMAARTQISGSAAAAIQGQSITATSAA
jgi:hypothetical protein